MLQVERFEGCKVGGLNHATLQLSSLSNPILPTFALQI